jgi:hypothetical protein
MNESALVACLACSLRDHNQETASPRDVVLAALKWPTEGWLAPALEWIDQGLPIDEEIASALEDVATKKHYSQALRHQAFAHAKRFRRAAQNI